MERSSAEFRLEIGCGGGEHLAGEALANPAVGFFGVEPFVNGLAQILARIEENGLTNVRLFDEDAARLLDWLPAASLSRVELLFPDPWPKRRHAKRRFVNRANLDRIARTLAPGGEFRFASDAPAYVNWTLRHCLDHPALRWMASLSQTTGASRGTAGRRRVTKPKPLAKTGRLRFFASKDRRVLSVAFQVVRFL